MKNKLFLALLSSLLIIGLVGCGSDDDIMKDDKKVEKEEEVKEVEYTYEFTKDSGILVTLVNPINEIVDIDVMIEYYNEAEELVSEEKVTLVAVHNLSSVKKHFKPVPDDSTSFVITPSYTKSDVTESYSNILDIISEDNGRDITVTVNNFETVPLSNVLIGILYYDNGEVVAYSEVPLSDVPASNSSSFSVGYPSDINGSIIYFDSVTTVANYAYND